MTKLLFAIGLAFAWSNSFAASEPCKPAAFTITKQSHRVDEFGRLLATAEVRNDGNAECQVRVHLVVTDKAGRDIHTQDLWIGGSPPMGRPLMVGESRKVDLMVPRSRQKEARQFVLTVTEAKP